MTTDSESRLRAIIETCVEGIITINERGIIESFNPAAEDIFAYRADEVIGKNISMLMPEHYQQEHDSFIKSYLASGEANIIGINREIEGKCKDGTVFPMWLSVSEFFDNDQKGFTGLVRNLSTVKSYIDKAATYEHILENSLNEIYLFDAETLRFIRANQGALVNLQYTTDEIVKLTPLDLKPEYTRESFEKLIHPLRIGGKEKVHFTTVHLRKDRSLYPVEVHLELFEFESKKVFVAIILDITEKIQAEEKSRIQQEQLAHLDRLSMMGEMAAGIAHELNQPLTAIDSYAQAAIRRIQSNSFDTKKLQDLLEKISKTSIRAGDVIAQLRAMVKHHQKSRSVVDVNTIIKDTIKIAEVDTQALDFNIELNLGNKLPHVEVNGTQIQQVLLNLIRNSMEAVVSDSKEDKVINISSSLIEVEDRVKISVQDYGCGISVDAEDQIFNPFYTTKKSGIGIGLAICRSIAQEHGGQLWFTRNRDKGTTFHLTLPIAADE